MPTRHLAIFCVAFFSLFTAYPAPIQAQSVQRVKSSPPRSSLPQVASPSLRQSPKYDPTSFIVTFKPDTTPARLQVRSEEREQRSRSILGRMRNTLENTTIIVRGEETPEVLLQGLQKLAKETAIVKEQPLPHFSAVFYLQSPGNLEQTIEKYQSNRAVASVQPNFLYRALTVVPNDTFYSTHQWNLRKMQVDGAWDITMGSSNVKVAVLDTGINAQHEEFTDNSGQLLPTIIKGKCLATHREFPLPTPLPNVTPGVDPCVQSTRTVPAYSCPGDLADDDNLWACGGGHGSQMTGIIKANLGNGRGIAGIAPGVTILAIKVMDKYGQGTSASLVAGINEAKNQGVKIINLSLGGEHEPAEDRVVSNALAAAKASGIAIFAAAGNDDTSIKNQFPANDPSVITVGATGPNDERASFSNYSEGNYLVEISAPGGNLSAGTCTAGNCIVSTGWDCSSQGGSNSACFPLGIGTSQATAHSSALAALLLSYKPTLTPDEIRDILVRTGDAVTTEANKPIGKRINALKALADPRVGAIIASPTTGPSPTPTITVPTNNPPTATPGPAITTISGRVINYAQTVALTGLLIEISFGAPANFFDPLPSPLSLDSGGNFSFRLQTNDFNLVDRIVSVQFTVKERQSGRIIRHSQPFEVTIGRENSGLAFTVYFCPGKTAGDANCDGVVDAKDYLVWKTEYRDSLTNPFSLGRADFNGDGVTNLSDFAYLVGKF